MLKKCHIRISFVSCVAATTVLLLAAHAETETRPRSVVVPTNDIGWLDWSTPLAQQGAKLFVLRGSFAENGALNFLTYIPPNYKVPPHFHDADEEFVVLSGSVYIGGMQGPSMVKAHGMLYRKDDVHKLPAKKIHWLFTEHDGVMAEIRTVGPFGTHWIEQ